MFSNLLEDELIQCGIFYVVSLYNHQRNTPNHHTDPRSVETGDRYTCPVLGSVFAILTTMNIEEISQILTDPALREYSVIYPLLCMFVSDPYYAAVADLELLLNAESPKNGILPLCKADALYLQPRLVNNDRFFFVAPNEQGDEEETLFSTQGYLLGFDTIPQEHRGGR